MRIFIALPIEKSFLKAFEKYRDVNGRIPYLRWPPLKNLHVTLLFLGEVPDDTVHTIESTLAEIVGRHEPYTLPFTGVTYAPPSRPPSMVWGRFAATAAHRALVADITNTAHEDGWVADRSFDPTRERAKSAAVHVTLARFKEKKPIPPRTLMRLKETGMEGVDMPVSQVRLMQSKLTKNGAEYRLVRAFPLG